MKPWRVSTPDDEEDFATEAEAITFAETYLGFLRQEAIEDGEWPDDIGLIRIYKISHFAQLIKAAGKWDELDEYAIKTTP